MRGAFDKLSSVSLYRTVTFVFSKTVYGFAAIKILMMWPVIVRVLEYHPVRLSGAAHVLFAPAVFAGRYPNVFLSVAVVIIVLSIFLLNNYFSAIVIFWIVASIVRATIPVINGADLVLMLLLFCNIFMADYPPLARHAIVSATQITVSNIAVLVCRLQIGFIYLLSGWDKLHSDLWRSGEAIRAIQGIEYFMRPGLELEFSDAACMVISWSAIAFEMSFPFLVWFRKTRMIVLAAGALFHVLIAVFLSLPDFGLVMMIAYLIFLNDPDYEKLKYRIRRLIP